MPERTNSILIGQPPAVVEVKGSHAVYVSQPQAVAAFNEKEATGVMVAAK